MANNKYCGNVSDFAPVSEDQSRVVIMYGLNPTEGEMAEWHQIGISSSRGSFQSKDRTQDSHIAGRFFKV